MHGREFELFKRLRRPLQSLARIKVQFLQFLLIILLGVCDIEDVVVFIPQAHAPHTVRAILAVVDKSFVV